MNYRGLTAKSANDERGSIMILNLLLHLQVSGVSLSDVGCSRRQWANCFHAKKRIGPMLSYVTQLEETFPWQGKQITQAQTDQCQLIRSSSTHLENYIVHYSPMRTIFFLLQIRWGCFSGVSIWTVYCILKIFFLKIIIFIVFLFYICLCVCRLVKGSICRECAHCSVLSTLKSAHI